MEARRAGGAWLAAVLAAALLIALAPAAFAEADEFDYAIAVSGHRFNPESVTVIAGRKLRLYIDNQDPTVEVFTSKVLGVRKAVGGRSHATIELGPLKPGEYAFRGELHRKSAKGVIVAIELQQR